jgi:hypothetical protein
MPDLSKMLLRLILSLWAVVAWEETTLHAEMLPESLIVENCGLAEAIVEGQIISSRMTPDGRAEVELRIKLVYRGSVAVGENLLYHSFRETRASPGSELIVFLIAVRAPGHIQSWAPATEFSEFPYSDPLAVKAQNCQ